MQTPTVKKRFAAEREALGLPAQSKELSIEEADAEAVLEASTPDAEVAELTLEENADPNVEAEPLVSAVLAEDDAFQIEQSKNLPPLRFRVGRNQHIELTEQGWRNVKSKSQEAAREEAAKQRIRRDWQHVRDKVMSYEMKDLSSKVLEEVLKRHAPTHTVTGMKERRSTAGRTVMEEQTWQEPIPNFQETKSFKRALSDLEGMIQRKREQAWRDAVNDKHSRRTANIANRKAERQEKARAIAVPVDAVPA